MSIGLKGTLKIIYKFPPMILTPMFSIWTIGPVMTSTKSGCLRCCTCYCKFYFHCKSCYNSPQKLGVSTCLTWANLLLTSASGFAYKYINIWNFHNGNFIVILLYPCLAISMVFLILLQCLDKCAGCCCPCLSCCESNCYPVTQFTYLDVNNMDVIITQEEIEVDQL